MRKSRNRGSEQQEDPARSGELHFHYNREERLRGASDALRRRSEPQSFFRRYRTALIIMLDLLVVLAMFGIYYLFGRGESSSAARDGYHYELKAVQFGEQALVTLRIQEQKENLDLAGTLVDVTFSVKGTDLSKDAKDSLPESVGGERVIRAVLEPLDPPAPRDHYEVAANVSVATGTIALTASVTEQ